MGGADCRIRPDAHRRVSGDWMAAVAGSGGCYGGCSPDAAVLPVSVLRRTLGSPGRHSPLLPGVWGVHSVKILLYWQNKAALHLQSGLAAVWNKRQCVPSDEGAASAAPSSGFSFFTYSALGPAATRALPASLAAYLEKFFTKREARSLALVSHSPASG